MMRKALFVVLALLSFSASASIRSCKVYKSWLEHRSAEEICRENNGHFCDTVENIGQGICYGSAGNFCATVKNTGQGICYAANGSFCNTVKNTAQGICYALSDNFCATMSSDEEAEMIDKLKDACNIDI